MDPRQPDDHDERPGGWHEPAHLGGGADGGAPGGGAPGGGAPGGGTPDADATRADDPRRDEAGLQPWAGTPTSAAPVWTRPGNALREAFAYQGDPWGMLAWAAQHGWEPSDGTGPRDAVLREVVAGGPVRPGRQAHPAAVVRGRAGSLELVAFDVVEPLGRGSVPRYAVTAAPMLTALPVLRLSPARIWKHRTGGLLHVPSGDAALDARWVLLAGEDSPQVRRLVQDPQVRALLLGSDDRDELWTAAGHVAAVRPDGHRPQLVDHHARLLTAVVGALSALG